jgi:predicted type IV restriction endonuclease
MDFAERIAEHVVRVREQKENVTNEEAVKTSLLLPFIRALGYDVFDPKEVFPEFTADIGTKKGEKVDYALLKDGEPIMLFECKCCGASLDEGKCAQLRRYFGNTSARIGILTDGVIYKFFTDLEKTNIMDEKPFMILNFDALDESLIPELKKLTKTTFDLAITISAASELKYTREIRKIIGEQVTAPTDDFVRFFASQVYSGKLTKNVMERFTGLVRRALNQFIDDQMYKIMESFRAEKQQDAEQFIDSEQGEKLSEIDGVVTTEEEMEGYYIVKSILREVVDVGRIALRDTKSYFGVLLDDNNRKPLCRLHFNAQQKYIGLFDVEKNEERIPIESLNDIYGHAERLKQTASFYEG